MKSLALLNYCYHHCNHPLQHQSILSTIVNMNTTAITCDAIVIAVAGSLVFVTFIYSKFVSLSLS